MAKYDTVNLANVTIEQGNMALRGAPSGPFTVRSMAAKRIDASRDPTISGVDLPPDPSPDDWGL